jgi:hypothetical protein
MGVSPVSCASKRASLRRAFLRWSLNQQRTTNALPNKLPIYHAAVQACYLHTEPRKCYDSGQAGEPLARSDASSTANSKVFQVPQPCCCAASITQTTPPKLQEWLPSLCPALRAQLVQLLRHCVKGVQACCLEMAAQDAWISHLVAATEPP